MIRERVDCSYLIRVLNAELNFTQPILGRYIAVKAAPTQLLPDEKS